jgi:putative DNA primase/helicase
MTICWATAAHAEAKGWTEEAPISWSDLVELLSCHDVRAHKDGRIWAPVSILDRSTRNKASVEAVHALVLDFDQGTPFQEVRPRLRGLAWVAHTSHSHSPEKAKYRLTIPLSSPVAAGEWPEVWRILHDRLGPESDPTCKNSNRIYYLPSKAFHPCL